MRTRRPVLPVTYIVYTNTTQAHSELELHRRMSDTDAVSVARLIALVKERPVLWDRQDEVYKNRKLTREAWAEICEALIENYQELGEHEKLAIGRSIIGKWANLRDNWLRYWRKRQELLRVGSSTKSLKKYIHHDQLLFLSKVYDPEGQQEVEEIQVEVDVLSDPEFESPVEFDESSQNSWNIPQCSRTIHSQDQSERHLYFFHSIMPMICDFDDDQMLEFHAGVLEWVKRVKHRQFTNWQDYHASSTIVAQEMVGNKGVFSKVQCEAAVESEYLFHPTQQVLLKEEPNEDSSYTMNNNAATQGPMSCSEVLGRVNNLSERKVKHNDTFDKSDLINLKDVVSNLETISQRFSAHTVGNNYDHFVKYIDSVFKELPSKKVLSLKRKIFKEVLKENFKKLKPSNDFLADLQSRCEIEKLDKSSNSNLSNTCDRENSSLDEKDTPSILRDTLKNVS